MEEKSQEEIIFHNAHSDHISGWYNQYAYKSHGNVIHWCYVFFGLQYADTALYGYDEEKEHGTVTWHGKEIAKYKFDDELQMPIFFDIVYDHASHTQDMYLKGLKNGLKEKFEEEYPFLVQD